ncbi:MAG: hypothetical protein ACAI25_18885 [Planctomycetota bacterium]
MIQGRRFGPDAILAVMAKRLVRAPSLDADDLVGAKAFLLDRVANLAGLYRLSTRLDVRSLAILTKGVVGPFSLESSRFVGAPMDVSIRECVVRTLALVAQALVRLLTLVTKLRWLSCRRAHGTHCRAVGTWNSLPR